MRCCVVTLLLVTTTHWMLSDSVCPTRGVRPHHVALNRAGSIELALIPGVGPTLAQRIVVTRQTQGRFERFEDLQRVPGVGPVLGRKIARYASLD
jgi:competence ComEA-like helix-hairpin-helix protein